MILEDKQGVEAKFEGTFGAQRVTLSPGDWRLPDGTHAGGDHGGLFTTGAVTGVGAGGALFSARWTNADRIAELTRLRIWAVLTTAYAAAQENSVDLVRVTNMASPDSGQTAIEMGEAGRMDRSNMTPCMMQMRISNAGAITAGAGSVEEAFAVRGVNLPLPNTAPGFAQAVLYDLIAGRETPFTLRNLEGFRIRNKIAQGAAGVISFTFEVAWKERPVALGAI